MIKNLGKRYLIVLIALLLIIAILSALLLYKEYAEYKENQRVEATLAFIDPNTGLHYSEEKGLTGSRIIVRPIYINYTGKPIRLEYVFVSIHDLYEKVFVNVTPTIKYIHSDLSNTDPNKSRTYMLEKGEYAVSVRFQDYDYEKYFLFWPFKMYVYVQ